MTKDQVAELIESIKEPLSPEDFLVALTTKAAEWGREQCRVPKMTDEQIWKCNSDGNGGFHICVAHQNVLEFARAIEREIGFNRANLWLKRINDAIAAEREKLAQWMIRRGYATGHGDTIEDLLSELEWQIDEKVEAEREACADIAENWNCNGFPRTGVADAIRARGQT